MLFIVRRGEKVHPYIDAITQVRERRRREDEQALLDLCDAPFAAIAPPLRKWILDPLEAALRRRRERVEGEPREVDRPQP